MVGGGPCPRMGAPKCPGAPRPPRWLGGGRAGTQVSGHPLTLPLLEWTLASRCPWGPWHLDIPHPCQGPWHPSTAPQQTLVSGCPPPRHPPGSPPRYCRPPGPAAGAGVCPSRSAAAAWTDAGLGLGGWGGSAPTPWHPDPHPWGTPTLPQHLDPPQGTPTLPRAPRTPTLGHFDTPPRAPQPPLQHPDPLWGTLTPTPRHPTLQAPTVPPRPPPIPSVPPQTGRGDSGGQKGTER